MPNQREIARLLGITQPTVSLALRGDLRISAGLRRQVREAAERLGYHPNAYVSVLMSHIRSGRKLSDKGVIALLIDARSHEDWCKVESYRVVHEGVIHRGKELGFHIENFFLRAPNMTIPKLERILHARGIQGIILAPPYRGNRTLDLHWERYAAVGIGFGWEQQELDRVAFDHLQNYIMAYTELLGLGYRRIGTSLNEAFIEGNCCGTKWSIGYLACRKRFPRESQIPILAIPNPPGENDSLAVHEEQQKRSVRLFKKWYEKWRPDALLTLTGFEGKWLLEMGVRIPEDVGLACLAQSLNPKYAQVDEQGAVVGATASELVAAKISRNEYGPSAHPKVTMVEGSWFHGITVKKKSMSGGSALESC